MQLRCFAARGTNHDLYRASLADLSDRPGSGGCGQAGGIHIYWPSVAIRQGLPMDDAIAMVCGPTQRVLIGTQPISAASTVFADRIRVIPLLTPAAPVRRAEKK